MPSNTHKDLIAILNQTHTFIDSIDDAAYKKPSIDGSSIGQHVRHILDFFEKLAALNEESNLVQYDVRERNRPVESSRMLAKQEIMQLLEKFNANVLDDAMTVKVSDCTSYDGHQCNSAMSSFGRERMYIVNHAIHHLAIIKAYFPNLNYPDDFGMSPSTVYYELTNKK